MSTTLSILCVTKEIIDYELQLKDLETVESRIAKTQKQAQTGGDKVAKMQYEVLKKYQDALVQGEARAHCRALRLSMSRNSPTTSAC